MNKYSLSDITWVSIETTNICNMVCDYCPKSLDELNHRKTGIDIFPKETYIKVIDFISSNLPNLNYVALTVFNEFFQTPELTTFYIPELQKRGIPYSILSNGSIKPKNIEYYAEYPPKYLVIGLQTITEKQDLLNNRLDSQTWDEYIHKVGSMIKFFYEKCPSTVISIEIAINKTNNLLHVVNDNSAIKNIPSSNEQLSHLPSLIETLSKLTKIKFSLGRIKNGRYDSQEIVASSNDNQIIFGLKQFNDINDFYSNIPLKHDPVCYTDSITFNSKGFAQMCCIDYKNSTNFADANIEDMSDIFEKYLSHVDTMRSSGSPFSSCRNCMGFKNEYDKLFNIKKNYYPRLLKKIPVLRRFREYISTI